ncbi:hypothetical protein ALC57_01761 [Trachymyrmex cornetzi]|uniref:Uncharacterized protein n=1 Tax=Trachymyrmex cornetzi TaxID=471704 RepID=A0A195EKN0_9HYME|nr:hypothetical protein ALC57_01761 [Trachymyrmex cornetzi]
MFAASKYPGSPWRVVMSKDSVGIWCKRGTKPGRVLPSLFRDTRKPNIVVRTIYKNAKYLSKIFPRDIFSFHFVINTAPLIPTVLYLHPSFSGLLFTAECGTSVNEQITRVTVEIDSEIKITRVGAHASRGPLIILGPLSQLAKLYAFRGWTVSVSDFYLRGYPRDR